MHMDDTPAWMVAWDVISRTHAELMSEALESLRAEMDAGRIKAEGDLVTSSELTAKEERDLFLLERLLGDQENLRMRYENLVRSVESGDEANPEIVARLEDVKKFLLTVSQMSITVEHAKVFSSWLTDAGRDMRETDPARMICATAKEKPERIDALGFVLGSKAFMRSGALDEEELRIMREAYERCNSTPPKG